MPDSIKSASRFREIFVDVRVREQGSNYRDEEINYVYQPNKIQFYIGQSINLPQTVRAKLYNGYEKYFPVFWNVNGLNLNVPGTYTIYGDVNANGRKYSTSVTIEVKKKQGSVDNKTKTEAKAKTNKKIIVRDIRGHWAERAIIWNLQNDIFSGSEIYNFEPEKAITRGELCTVLFRAAGANPNQYTEANFNDIGFGQFYDAPIEWARQNNIVSGYPDGTFKPEKKVNRQEFAVMMNRFINCKNLKFQGKVYNEFADLYTIEPWARQDVRQLQAYGLISGYPGNIFKPDTNVKRAEVAQILYNTNRRVSFVKVASKTTSGTNATQGTSYEPLVYTQFQNNISGVQNNDQNNLSNENEYTPLPNGNVIGNNPNVNNNTGNNQAYAYVSIDVKTAAAHMDKVDPDKRSLVPSDGWILSPVKVPIEEGEAAWDVLSRVASQNGINIQSEFYAKFNSVYIQAINGLGEFDAGDGSGWMYNINGSYPDRGASIIKLRNGDRMEWRYTLDLGKDIGGHLSSLENLGR